MQRKAFNISGRVQGVGFRPFVFRLAVRFALSGTVRNAPQGVLLEVQGPKESISAFAVALHNELPPLARITSCTEHEIAPVAGENEFVILQSEAGNAHAVLISPDIATCNECLADTQNPQNRRYLYPFTNCTNCGPRYSITANMPYDRAQTSMACFELCPECGKEYNNPLDRRFHAQPNACPVCGPQVWLVNNKQLAAEFKEIPSPYTKPGHSLTGNPALKELAKCLMQGQIAAVKGLGGFHLVCNAASDAAVAKLRSLKNRPHKPLAIMVKNAKAAAYYLNTGEQEQALLNSIERPIVLCPRHSKEPEQPLAQALSPDTRYIGVMLPYTPLHHILLHYCQEYIDGQSGINKEYDAQEGNTIQNSSIIQNEDSTPEANNTQKRDSVQKCDGIQEGNCIQEGNNTQGSASRSTQTTPVALVMTSGNRGGEPIALGNREALTRLSDMADCMLLHNRDILIRTDDSVLRPIPAYPKTESLTQKADLSTVKNNGESLAKLAAPLQSSKQQNAAASVMYIRRARGFVPQPLPLPKQQTLPLPALQTPPVPAKAENAKCILALGAELKNTVCLTRGSEAFVSQHIGDLQNLETSAFQQEISSHLAAVLQVEPELIVHDAHPDFVNQSNAARSALPARSLQHHFAHAAAVLAENKHTSPALVLALDGTGFAPQNINPQKHIWGGELILAHPAKKEISRIGTFAPLPLPGGEAAIRAPWRIAHATLLLQNVIPPQGSNSAANTPTSLGQNNYILPWLPQHQTAAAIIPQMLSKGINTPFTSSAGRLFDAAAALLGLCLETSYEGQAAIRLEDAQHETAATLNNYTALYTDFANGKISALPCPVTYADPTLFTLNTIPLLTALHSGFTAGNSVHVLARAFHWSLAQGLAQLCLAASQQTGITHIGLSGGVMQNMSMHVLLTHALTKLGLVPLTHHALPANDGCISFGQAAWFS